MTIAQDRLTGLFRQMESDYPGGVSNTSTAKFNNIRDYLSELFLIQNDDVYIVGAGKKRSTNLPIRLSQGEQATKHTKLGIGFVESDGKKTLEDLTTSASKTITNYESRGQLLYDSIILVLVDTSGTHVSRMFNYNGNSFDSILRENFPDAEIVDVRSENATPPYTPTSGELIGKLYTDLESKALLSFGSDSLAKLIASLLAKRFLILTGLSGSGKTKLAQAFATWTTEEEEDTELIPVGADWTSRDNVLGYVDTINGKYRKEAALELILKTQANCESEDEPTRPFFLILDEMNLSHVERYFADFLSAIESEKAIPMHREDGDLDGVPQDLALPKNLFVIGTVNVDETTYMFSPKVLDRANTIEFRVDPNDFDTFMDEAKPIDLSKLREDGKGLGSGYGPALVEEANKSVTLKGEDNDSHEALKQEMGVLIRLFASTGWEFGYRTGKEVSRFVYFHKLLTETDWKFDDALDAQIVQKLMPKLNGSEDKLRAILKALAWYSSGFVKIPDKTAGEDPGAYYQRLADKFTQLSGKSSPEDLAKALREKSNPLDGANAGSEFEGIDVEAVEWNKERAKLPLTFDKTLRMWKAARLNGFTSYAEN